MTSKAGTMQVRKIRENAFFNVGSAFGGRFESLHNSLDQGHFFQTPLDVGPASIQKLTPHRLSGHHLEFAELDCLAGTPLRIKVLIFGRLAGADV